MSSLPSPTGNPISDVTLVGVLALAAKELLGWLKAEKQSDDSLLKELIQDLRTESRDIRESQVRLLESIHIAIGELKQAQSESMRLNQQSRVDSTGLLTNQKVLRDMTITIGGQLKTIDQRLVRLHERIDELQQRNH